MEIKFYNMAGTLLFARDDMEEGHWTQEEMSVNLTFPFDREKAITRGMRLLFADPATGDLQLFEIRHLTNTEPEHYQQIVAESVAISELSDEHINQQEITNKTPTQALGGILTGTLWSVGNVTATNVSSCNIGRGSVWQAVGTIQTNWNVYITPRVTVSANGNISGRYLDIAPAQGTWRGLRLSVDKNMADAAVTYDDTEILTALYGYGGSVEVSGQDEMQELTFEDEVWTATADHPAKPAGQTYIEDPAATALYGRNGRPRFGYYQNGDIKDADVLLEKTWEALKLTREPRISISGTTADLRRLGYNDVPLRLHDTAIIEIPETGEKFQKQIIRLDIDLLDPTANRPEIGDYIPNIIYINRETAERASGGGVGGRGQTNVEYERQEFHTNIDRNDYLISLKATQEDMDTVDEILRQAGIELDAQTGVIVYHTDNALMLQSKLNVQAGRIDIVIDQGGNVKAGVIIDAANQQLSGSAVKILADIIDIDGLVTALKAKNIGCGDLHVEGEGEFLQTIYAENWIHTDESLSAGTTVTAGTGFMITGSNDTATWQSTSVVTGVTVGAAHDYVYHDQYGQEQLANGKLVTAVTANTLHYLGSVPT